MEEEYRGEWYQEKWCQEETHIEKRGFLKKWNGEEWTKEKEPNPEREHVCCFTGYRILSSKEVPRIRRALRHALAEWQRRKSICC